MAGPFVFDKGHAKLIGDGTILAKDGYPAFTPQSFTFIQPDYGQCVSCEQRNDALTLTSRDNSIIIEGDHDSKTVLFSVSKEFMKALLNELLNEREKSK